MKTKIMKAIALCLALVLCFGSAISVSAAEVADATIDESQKGSLTIFKYDLTGSENAGIWDSSYVSTGVADESGVNETMKNYALEGVEFSFVKVADIVQFMQASECGYNTLYPHAPGSITDPEYSINVGIQNLADCLSVAQCESPMDMDAIKLALQGYNYGQGYITWAMNKYGEYTKANAVEFSVNAAERYGWSSYGDMDYVPHVLRYYPLGQILYDPDTSTLIVEVARSQIGNVGGEPYWSWYGFTERVEWCACFVSWCADRCGYIDSGVIPKFSGCINGMDWFKNRGQWAGNHIEPIPGMIIFFDWEDESYGEGLNGLPDHVGIVEKVENGRVYTIEGNTSDSCRQRSYPVGYYQILGYGIPGY